MSTYVMSDIHGCFDEFMKMLKLIKLKDDDTLVIAGDYVDRGPKNIEVLEWLVNKPDNVVLLMGNHDLEFVEYLTLMEVVAKATEEEYPTNPDSYEDFGELYCCTESVLRQLNNKAAGYFDYYSTIVSIISEKENGVTLLKAVQWRKMLEALPYVYRTEVNGREVIVVHAGYIENMNQYPKKDMFIKKVEDFYLHARNEAIDYGGKENAIIIAGHTPTIVEGYFYNKGRIYHFHDDKRNCDFYDIDCGAVFKTSDKSAHLACLRIDDMKEFYV